ncbi:class C beta-lactamase-related serine hydrolase [Flavobacterium arcticum]|uniref:Class C beta-lactamase-related serine hydrolase n=1 Tax=Flavobacterium arcticum TaxID=1784713 RepID=A0A345H820_9FLAO|nr:serine hydrolase [Flavobacterium arcticum]AXG72730.1 class C beta-lactamase-related serine hydrolase [Flavobacterium arcticum]KAF2510999.1 serine hydrolase [Flavobacterium arcticum]
MRNILLAFSTLFIISCNSDNNDTPPIAEETETMYFPDNNTDIWETKSSAELGWNESAKSELVTFLETKNSKSFMILVNGRIVMEEYFDGHTATTPWYWASAGKTLTTALTGIAEQEGYLDIDSKVSDYLGIGWTNAPVEKENLITSKHLLTMTSGLDDALGDNVSPANLQYVADAGTRWAYHNVYVKLQDIVAEATAQSWNDYFNNKLKSPTGMTGAWIPTGDLNVYWSTTRSMARFGLLALNNGKWKEQQIINSNYFNNAITPSQSINKSYGYLWWINGEQSYHLPQTQFEFQGSIIPSGSADMYMALGKNDQKIYVIPSKKMVIIRMGNTADDENFAVSDFDEELWVKINFVIN